MEDLLGEVISLPIEILTFMFGILMVFNLQDVNYKLLDAVADVSGQREVIYEDSSNQSVEGYQPDEYTETGAQIITDLQELYGQDGKAWVFNVEGATIGEDDVVSMVQESDYNSITNKVDITSYPMTEYEVNVARAEVE